MPLGRLGSGLALIYHDVVTAPLPPAMAVLIRRLEAAMEREAAAPVTLSSEQS